MEPECRCSRSLDHNTYTIDQICCGLLLPQTPTHLPCRHGDWGDRRGDERRGGWVDGVLRQETNYWPDDCRNRAASLYSISSDVLKYSINHVQAGMTSSEL